MGKAAARPQLVRVEEMSVSEPPLDVSKVADVVKTGGVAFHRDQACGEL